MKQLQNLNIAFLWQHRSDFILLHLFTELLINSMWARRPPDETTQRNNHLVTGVMCLSIDLSIQKY